MSLGPGHSPDVLVPPCPAQELVEMQVPLVLPTVQVAGDGLVQHFTLSVTPYMVALCSIHTWMLSAPGQSPAVLFPPSALHASVEMQVPLKLSALQVTGAVGLVQH